MPISLSEIQSRAERLEERKESRNERLSERKKEAEANPKDEQEKTAGKQGVHYKKASIFGTTRKSEMSNHRRNSNRNPPYAW